MKKLLTIIALALVLCLGVSSALAADLNGLEKQLKTAGTKYGDEWTNGAAELLEKVKAADTLVNGVMVSTSKSTIQNRMSDAKATAVHAEYSIITVSGTKYTEQDATKTYTKVTADPKFDASKTIYYTYVDADGKTQYAQITDMSKVDSSWVYTWKDDKDVTHTSDAYTLDTKYNYKDEGYAEIQLRVMLAPHDKLGEATTGADGKITYKCSCGKEWAPVDKPDPATCKHEWAWKYVEGKEPTCVKEGKEVETCVLCGKINEGTERVAAAKGHTWGKTVMTPPTCYENTMVESGWSTKPGKATSECTVCGAKWEADANVDDYRTYLRTELGYTLAEANAWVPHTWSYGIVEPTCSSEERIIKICENCHAKSYEPKPGARPALNADYVAVNVPNCKDIKKDTVITLKCANCGSAYAGHPVLTYTITEADVDELKGKGTNPGTFSITRYVNGNPFTIRHTGEMTETDEKKQFVCDAYGNKLSKKVEDAICGDTIWNQCTCSVCEAKTIEKQLKKIDHIWGDWKLSQKTETINEYKRACTICAVVETTWATEAPGKVCEEGKHVPAPRHVQETTCEYWGLDPLLDAKAVVLLDMYCTVCGADLDPDEYTIEHDWVLSDELSKPATCTETGSLVYKCSVCEKVVNVEAAVAAHDLEKVEAVAPTCSAVGYEAYWTCKVCGGKFADEEALVEIEAPAEVAIDANAHKWDAGKVTTPAAEGKKGEKTFTCTLCGKTKTEEIAALPVPAKYDVDKLDYTNPLATGKVTLEKGTEALKQAYARVTFFLANGDCMIQIVEVDKDGNFTAGAIGNFVHISVVIVDVDNAYGAQEAIDHAHGNGGIKL